jgi:hypothetical protein
MLRSPMCRQIARTVCNSVVILSLPTSPFADLDDPDALLGAESDSDAFRMKLEKLPPRRQQRPEQRKWRWVERSNSRNVLSVHRSHGITSTR